MEKLITKEAEVARHDTMLADAHEDEKFMDAEMVRILNMGGGGHAF